MITGIVAQRQEHVRRLRCDPAALLSFAVEDTQRVRVDTTATVLTEEDGRGDFAAEAQKLDMPVIVSDYITRSAPAGSSLPSQIVNMGFDLSEANPYPDEAVSVNGMFYVFRVVGKRLPSPDLFSKKEEAFRSGLLERKKSVLLASWLANVREKAEIEITPQFL